MGRQALIISMSLTLLPLAFIGSVSAHGGVVYPPIWQAGASIPLDEIVNDDAFTDPPVRDQVDLREGTYPEGSVWRPVGRYGYPLALRMDSVIVPANLKRGEYVLSFRWDTSGGNQVWVSCASIKLVKSAAGRSDDNDDYSYYTADDYDELEHDVFESTRSDEDDDDDDDYDDYSLYTDEDYEELEQAFESTRADED